MNELTFESKWEDIIEQEDRKSLSNLINNLHTHVTQYSSVIDRSDFDKATVELNILKEVASNLINHISSVITNIQKKEEKMKFDVSIRGTNKETETKIRKFRFIGEKGFFVGRIDYLNNKLKNELEKPGSRVSLVGPGGSGKSQLAFKALHQYYEKDKIIGLIVCVYLYPYSNAQSGSDRRITITTNITFRKFLNDIGHYLIKNEILPLTEQQFDELDVEECKTEIYNLLSNIKHPVLYCDNFETISLTESDKKDQSQETIKEINYIFNFLNNELPDNTSILVTSRNAKNYLTREKKIDLFGLEMEEAIPLFIENASTYRQHLENMQDRKIQDILKTIAKKTGGHPFSIEILAKSYKGGGSDELEKISNTLGEDRENAFEPEERLKSLDHSFSYSINTLSSEQKRLLPLLTAFLSPFPTEAVKSIFGAQEELEDVSSDLYNKSIIMRIEGDQYGQLDDRFWIYTIHPALRNYLEERYNDYISQIETEPDFISKFCNFFKSLGRETCEAWGTENHRNFMRRFHVMTLSEGKNDFDKAIELAETIGTEWGKHISAELASYVGTIYNILGQYDKSLSYHNKSLAKHLELSYRDALTVDYTEIGLIYIQKGQYDEALSYYKKSLEIHEKSNNKGGMATDYNNIGWAHYNKGQYDEALSYHKKSLEINEELNSRIGLAHNYRNLGLVYRAKGQYDESLSYHKKSLEIHEDLKDRINLAFDYRNIGRVYVDKGQYDDALSYHKKSLEINEEFNDRVNIAGDYRHLGLIYLDKGQYDDALSYHKKSLEIHEEVNDKIEIVRDYVNFGYLHLANKTKEKAKEAEYNASRVKIEFERDTGNEHPLKNLINELLTSINESTD